MHGKQAISRAGFCAVAIVLALAALGGCCNRRLKSGRWIELALALPEHQGDWQMLRNGLSNVEIECKGGPSSLGSSSLMVRSSDFDHAKQEAIGLIVEHSLTVRLCSTGTPGKYQVWQHGNLVKEGKGIPDHSVP